MKNKTNIASKNLPTRLHNFQFTACVETVNGIENCLVMHRDEPGTVDEETVPIVLTPWQIPNFIHFLQTQVPVLGVYE